jgi:hypothetical protein
MSCGGGSELALQKILFFCQKVQEQDQRLPHVQCTSYIIHRHPKALTIFELSAFWGLVLYAQLHNHPTTALFSTEKTSDPYCHHFL